MGTGLGQVGQVGADRTDLTDRSGLKNRAGWCGRACLVTGGLALAAVLGGCVFSVTAVPEESASVSKRFEALEKRVEALEQRNARRR